MGTPEAMSPEQIKGQPCDNRSDLWALGVAVVGLDQHDIGLGVLDGVVLHAQLHARVDHGAESLAQNSG